MIIVLSCLIFIQGCSKDDDKLDFSTNSISLYKLIEVDGVYKFNKIGSFIDDEVVKNLINDCQKFDFKELNEEDVINLSLIYYLVFDDSGVVIEFGDINADMGRIGVDFNAEYQGEGGYKETDIADFEVLDSYYVHLPLNSMKILKEYIK